MAKSPLHIWQILLYTKCTCSGLDGLDQINQFEQFLRAPHRPPACHHVEGIGRNKVRPRRRQRAKVACAIMEPRPILAPALPPLDQVELVPEQQVRWMRYTKRSSFNVPLRCS